MSRIFVIAGLMLVWLVATVPAHASTDEVVDEATRAAALARNAASSARFSAEQGRQSANRAISAMNAANDAPAANLTEWNWDDGSYYIGESSGDVMQGVGIYIYGNRSEVLEGDRYDGDMWDNKFIGYGVYVFNGDSHQKGDWYEGEFRNDWIAGSGIYHDPGSGDLVGTRYEGLMADGDYEGSGTIYWDDGVRYEGDVKKGSMTGYGVYYFAGEFAGHRYEGQVKDGYFHGYGIYYYADGGREFAYREQDDPVGETLYVAAGETVPETDVSAIPTEIADIGRMFEAVKNANVRSRPDQDSRRITTLLKGTRVMVSGQVLNTDWYAVEKDNRLLGYVWMKLLVPVTSGSTEQTVIQEERLEILGSGSGFFVSSKGHIVTSSHVIEGCTKLEAGFDPNHLSPADLISKDTVNDLALITAPIIAQGVAFRDRNVRLGESIMVAGFPYGDEFSSSIKVTTGIVSSTLGYADDAASFQLDAAVQPGNSGGPIFDKSGNVVGVVIATLDKLELANTSGSIPENSNFGIKASTVRTFLDGLDIPPKLARGGEAIDTELIAEESKAKTVMVTCWGKPG